MPKKGRIIASIEARLGSTRLPGKVLKEIMGRPMLELMVERVKRSKYIDEIVIATSVNPKDGAIEEMCRRLGIVCYRGSEDDVLARVLGAAKHIKGDHIVELWGDAPLIDPGIIDATINHYVENDYDCVGIDRKFPWGMNLLVFPTNILEEVSLITNDPVDRENVSNYIYEHPDKYKFTRYPCPPELSRPDIRLAVDELPDFELVKTVFERLMPRSSFFSVTDIIKLLDAEPELKDINKCVKQKKLRQD